MGDEAKPKFEIPWGTLLPVLAALAGVIAQFKPLVSTRPSVAAARAVPVIAEQDVDARLWQDPIAVAQKQKAALLGDMTTGAVPPGHDALYVVDTLVRLLHERVAAGRGKVLLLGVMIDAGPYSEQAEARLRSRQAVLEGLSESGFVPRDGEHIGYVTVPWPIPEKTPGPIDSRVATGQLIVPWEECEKDNRDQVFPKDTSSVLVLWLPASNFDPTPLSRFGALIDLLAHDVRDKVDVKLLGPANSTGLQNMVREVNEPNWNTSTHEDLDGVEVISGRATASDEMLLFDPAGGPAASGVTKVKALLESRVPRGPRGGLQFQRTVATDEVVLRKLIAELRLRHVPITPRGSARATTAPPPSDPHIILLSEWDTPYGRSLGYSFYAEAYQQTIQQIVARRTEEKTAPRAKPGQGRIHTYRYVRGIDGQLPGDPARASAAEQAHKNSATGDPMVVESTEGLNQADYLRRLARVLKDNESKWKLDGGSGIGAIGLLGSDTYDKLMILRALRPQFPSTIFFTNTYDAHFERPDDYEDLHNLVIGSPFGNTLPDTLRRQRVAPFRDSNQTATYASTLIATGRIDQTVADYLSWQPRIFEIGRRGAQELSDPWYLEGENLSRSDKRWFREWLHSDGVIWHLAAAALALALIVAWVSASNAHRSLPGGGTTPQRLGRVLSSTPFWVICGTPVIILTVAAYAQSDQASLEPFAFFGGVSLWPSEMVRLVALMLAIHFMVKAGIDLRANAEEIEQRFCLKPLPRMRFRWADIGLGFELWRTAKHDRAAQDRLTAQAAWYAYQRRNKFWPRFIRVGILFILYLAFSFLLFSIFPQGAVPGRGDASFHFDRLVLLPSVVALMILSFYVVDAIQLNSNFIRLFAREVTRWGHGVIEQSRRSPPLNEEELSAYHEIFFVAQRTEVVARLIWYPLIVLTLMVFARWSFFDNWPWPVGLVSIFALNAAWALGSAVYLRRAAEQLRTAALNNLALLRLGAFADGTRRETFEELIEEIRRLKKGAFAPLGEQPFIRAILVPSGGLGLIAVAERLLDLF